MTTHVFLSPEWIARARELRDRYRDRVRDPGVELRINVRITETPFGDDVVGFVDSTDGVIVEEGLLEGADIDLTLSYETAFELFVCRDPQVMMQAFFGGRIRAEGDVARLLALQSQPPPEEGEVSLARGVYEEIIAFTEGAEAGDDGP